MRASKKYARSLIERNAWRRKMNDNVISIRGSNEKYDWSVECAMCFAKIENSRRKTTDAPIIDLYSTLSIVSVSISFARGIFFTSR